MTLQQKIRNLIKLGTTELAGNTYVLDGLYTAKFILYSDDSEPVIEFNNAVNRFHCSWDCFKNGKHRINNTNYIITVGEINPLIYGITEYITARSKNVIMRLSSTKLTVMNQNFNNLTVHWNPTPFLKIQTRGTMAAFDLQLDLIDPNSMQEMYKMINRTE